MIDIREFEKLKAKMERLKAEKSKSEGALAEVKGQIRQEFGCTSLKAMEQLKMKLSMEADEAEEEYEAALVRFEREFAKMVELS